MKIASRLAKELTNGDVFAPAYGEYSLYQQRGELSWEPGITWLRMDAVMQVHDLLMLAVTDIESDEHFNLDLSSQMPVLVQTT